MTVAVMQKAERGIRKQRRNRRQNRVMMTAAVMQKAGTGVRKQRRHRRKQVDGDSSSDEESWDVLLKATK